jgi:hypothetical protein
LDDGGRPLKDAGPSRNGSTGVQRAQILDLFAGDSWRHVYAGELEVRPPGAPTTGWGESGWMLGCQ